MTDTLNLKKKKVKVIKELIFKVSSNKFPLKKESLSEL